MVTESFLTYVDKCPCCGGIALLKKDANSILNYYGFQTFYITCEECGLRTEYGDKELVIKKWNRREYNGKI